MQQRKLGSFNVSAIGLGCMNLSHGYDAAPGKDASIRLLNEALDMGYTHLDTAALYGFGANETLLGEAVMHRRSEFTLASKCGLFKGQNGQRGLDGRPETIKRTCEDSLARLGTDVIDLYYLHRLDRQVPIEDSVGALSELAGEGKIKSIGLSEISAKTLRKAHSVHPISAVQTEYSLWSRNAEIAVLAACRDIGAAFVAFSPVARGYLTGKLRDVRHLSRTDIRRTMPRFEPDNYAANLKLLDGMQEIADQANCTMAQLALAWVLSRGDHVIPIPGTTNQDHLQENLAAQAVVLNPELAAKLEGLINRRTVSGARYSAAAQADVDTEQF